MALDFGALNQIAYRGFEMAEELKDSLTEKGYSIIDNAENPFLQASEPLSSSAWTESSGAPQTATERKGEPFISSSGQDYKALYKAAYDYHQRYTPPVVDRKYWGRHTAGIDDIPEAELDYWRRAAEDVTATAQAWNDSFLTGLLGAVYDELSKEYNRLRENAQKQASEAV